MTQDPHFRIYVILILYFSISTFIKKYQILCKQEILTKKSTNSNGLTQFFNKKMEIEKIIEI